MKETQNMNQQVEQQTGQPRAVVFNYQDSVFRMLFREKKELLSLFNAINGTDYTNPEDLQVNTLENAIYMATKNDISCVLDMQMNLFEHQSTVNPNIPLRDLHYVSTLYEKLVPRRNLYSSRRILLPTPRFIVLYNGSKEQPERKELRLSDSYMMDTGKPGLELVVLQLNINEGYNNELMENCQTLWEYVQYTERVRRYRAEMPLEQAVEKAVQECIKEGILADFLRKNRAEVINMSIFEYDEKLHMEVVREEGWEDGWEDGHKEGIRIGIREAKQNTALCMIRGGKLSLNDIAEYAGLPLDEVKTMAEEELLSVQA